MKRIKLILILVLLAGLLATAACTVETGNLEDIKWVLTDYSVDGESRSLVPDTDVTIFFVSEDKEVNGTGGCNSYFASYEVDGSSLSIPGPIAATEMWCGDEIGEQERVYMEALQAAESYEVKGDKLTINCGDTVLNFEPRESKETDE